MADLRVQIYNFFETQQEFSYKKSKFLFFNPNAYLYTLIFGTNIDPEFESKVESLTKNLKESNNYGDTEIQAVSSRLMEAGDRRDTYEKWLTTIKDSKTSEPLRSLIEEGRRKNERGAPQGERAGTGDSESNGNESSRANRGGSERLRKQSPVDTQQFFSDTVKGNNKPLKPWEPLYPLI
ncbi:hypothetical protein EQP59_00790 [Ornithobacterium rhinotracheale]|uniref:Uncharacterized protein n=1 Tax=Ornithobacterium rhinotracheale TaxID=28251 RepID=A0A3R5XSB4_ORNRH|nr:hypothetical protein [Ornithobacterium rhinotracheale]QAR29998.1 hypothetical protein EQP59_00790 [Ornithobacterium rhinotracheale]